MASARRERRRASALLIAAVLAAPTRARAEPTPADRLLAMRGELTDPNEPAFELAGRGGMRGMVGARLPIYHAAGAGLLVEIPTYIELHNRGEGVIPNEMWRGHVTLAASWLQPRAASLLWVGGEVEHESEHHLAQWVYWNSISGVVGYATPIDGWRVLVQARLRAHVSTCTRSALLCTGEEPGGDASLEGDVDVVADRPLRHGLDGFVAGHVDVLPENGVVADERRGVVRAGVIARGRRGDWQLFGNVLVGDEAGFDRQEPAEVRYGLGVRWSPAP